MGIMVTLKITEIMEITIIIITEIAVITEIVIAAHSGLVQVE